APRQRLQKKTRLERPRRRVVKGASSRRDTMAIGLVAYDVIFLVVGAAVYGGAAIAALYAYGALSRWLPGFLSLVPAGYAGLLVLIAEVAILTAMCPRLRPGRYPLMKGPVFYGWLFRSLLRRLLFVPSLRWFIFSSNVLRYLSFRAMGAKIAFST